MRNDTRRRPLIPSTPEQRLSRDEAAVALTAAGYPITASTLQTYACRGGGPDFDRFNGRPIYVWGPTLRWAEGRRRAPLRQSRAA